jgi:hypothetical protein
MSTSWTRNIQRTFSNGHAFLGHSSRFSRKLSFLLYLTGTLSLTHIFLPMQAHRHILLTLYTWCYLIATKKYYLLKESTALWTHLYIFLKFKEIVPLKKGKKVKLSLCLTKHHAMKTYRGSGCTSPCILDLGTSWRRVVSFMHRPLYPRGKNPWYSLDRKLVGPQSRSGHIGEEKHS